MMDSVHRHSNRDLPLPHEEMGRKYCALSSEWAVGAADAVDSWKGHFLVGFA